MGTLSRLAVNDEGFVFNPMTGDSFQVNETGLAILKALREGKNESAIAALIAEEYEVGVEEAGRDVADFLGQLKTFALV